MGSSVPPNFPPNPQNPFPPQAPLPPGKKSNILIWILGGVVVLVLGATAMCGLGGYLLMHKAKESGLDTALLQKNPAFAAAKMAATLNPDVEVLSSDDSTGTIKVREKSTGKVTSMRFDPDKKQMVVTGEDGKESTIGIAGEGDKTSINIHSADGTATFGAGGDTKLPSWLPGYPGATPKGTFTSTTNGTTQSAFGFNTPDSVAQVLEYYQTQLKSSGFDIKQSMAAGAGGMIAAENGGRTVTVTVGANGKETSVSLMTIEK
jgi:hypothetical protein